MSHIQEIWGLLFQLGAGGLVYYSEYQQIFITIILHTFSRFFVVVQGVLLNRTRERSLVA